MTQVLLFLLGANPQAPLRWGRFEGRRLIEGGWLESAADLVGLSSEDGAGVRVIGLLPGEQVAARRTAPLSRDTGKARAAAAYLMEDELGEAPDDLHVAVASVGDASLAIAAKRSIVEAWLAAFLGSGLEIDVLSTDYLALAPAAENAVVVFEKQRVVAAVDGAGLATELDLFSAIASQLFKTPPLRIEAIGDATLRSLLPAQSEIDWLGAADDARVLALFGSTIAETDPPNLLQGRYAKKRSLMPRLAPWRRAAGIAAGATAVLLVGVIAQGMRADSAANAWTEAARKIHAERFPGDTSADPVAHARALLAAGASSASFLELTARFGQAIEGHDDVSIDRIRFSEAAGEFTVSVRSKTDVGIEQLKTRLAGLGVSTQDSGGYRRSGDSWSGELSARLQ